MGRIICSNSSVQKKCEVTVIGQPHRTETETGIPPHDEWVQKILLWVSTIGTCIAFLFGGTIVGTIGEGERAANPSCVG